MKEGCLYLVCFVLIGLMACWLFVSFVHSCSLKEMNKETCIMKRPRRPSRLPLFYHFLFNVAFLSGVIAGSLSRTPVLTLLGAIGVLLLLNGIWFWTTGRYKDS